MSSTITYVVYEKGWPICTGPLDYVARVTGRSKATLMRKNSNQYVDGGHERVVMDEKELERRRM